MRIHPCKTYQLSRRQLLRRLGLGAGVMATGPMLATPAVAGTLPTDEQSDGLLRTVDYDVRYRLVNQPCAYQPLSIQYQVVRRNGHAGALWLEANAYENPERSATSRFTTAIPGSVSAEISYYGHADISTGSELHGNLRDRLQCDTTGQVGATDRYCFLSVKNTGDTLWRAQGAGQVTLALHTLNAHGTEIGSAIETWRTLDDDVYPGETIDYTVDDPYLSAAGAYTLRFQVVVQRTPGEPYVLGIMPYSGTVASQLELPFTVLAANAPAAAVDTCGGGTLTNPGIARAPDPGLTTTTEFLSAYTSHTPSHNKGTLDVVLPPWPTVLTVRAIGADADDVAVARIPLTPDTQGITMGRRGGGRVAATWTVGDKKPFVSTWYYPYRERVFADDPLGKIAADLRRMQQAGITVVYLQLFSSWMPFSHTVGESIRFTVEEAARIGLPVLPSMDFFRQRTLGSVTNTPVTLNTPGDFPGGIDIADPNFPLALARYAAMMYDQYGAGFYRTTDGKVAINLSEDQMGAWHFDFRGYRWGYRTKVDIAAWRNYLRTRYPDIAALNAAWATGYASFTDVLPPQVDGFEPLSTPYAEWNTPLSDWDHFRSHLFATTYAQAAALTKERIPEALVGVQVEGAAYTGWKRQPPGYSEPFSLLGFDWFDARQGVLGEDLLTLGKLDFAGGVQAFQFDEAREGEFYIDHGVVPLLYPPHYGQTFFHGCDPDGSTGCDYAGLGRPGYEFPALRPLLPVMKQLWTSAGVTGFYSWNDYTEQSTITPVQERELRFISTLLAP